MIFAISLAFLWYVWTTGAAAHDEKMAKYWEKYK